MKQIISFQGELGAYSHQACEEVFPKQKPLPCHSFADAIAAVQEGRADMAMLPVENSTYGRVADIHTLLPESGLHIIGEHFVRVHVNLFGIKGAQLSDIKSAMSHTVLLGQSRGFLAKHSIKTEIGADTAGSAKHVAEVGDKSLGALSSELAGELYGLDLLARHIEDNSHNTTRFLITAPKPQAAPRAEKLITTLIFEVRNLPSALYKAMGGFATNGVNMLKLESYMVNGSFTATQFYADVEGHPEDEGLKRALEELAFFTSSLRVLGTYPVSSYRDGLG